MRKWTWLFIMMIFVKLAPGQAGNNLPVTILHHADTTKPFIVYITGDGGFNSFSKTLMQQFYSKGYSVIALNAKDYFWDKKTPQKAAADVSRLISQHLSEWKHKNFILAGYSFGADVAPFIYSRLPLNLQNKASQLVLLSPSEKTNFEVHIIDMLGFGKQSGESVIAEINKIDKPVLFVFGSDEKDFPVRQVSIKNKKVLTLDGGHHYGGDASNLGQEVLQSLAGAK